MYFRIAHAKNAQNDVVSPRENVGAQDIDRNDRKRSGNFGQQLLPVPRPKTNEAVALLGESFPFDGRRQWLPPLAGDVLKKRAQQFEMLNDFWHIAATKIVVRHKIKMRLDFVGIIRGKSFSHRSLQALALDFCLFV